jgi:hypothetical protein
MNSPSQADGADAADELLKVLTLEGDEVLLRLPRAPVYLSVHELAPPPIVVGRAFSRRP